MVCRRPVSHLPNTPLSCLWLRECIKRKQYGVLPGTHHCRNSAIDPWTTCAGYVGRQVGPGRAGNCMVLSFELEALESSLATKGPENPICINKAGRLPCGQIHVVLPPDGNHIRTHSNQFRNKKKNLICVPPPGNNNSSSSSRIRK